MKEKTLLEMNEREIQELISNSYGCLNCGKAISYEVLKSRFCLDCNIRYSDQIRKLKKKSLQIRILEERKTK